MVKGNRGFPVPLKKMVQSWRECGRWCGEEDDCKMWTYSPSQGTCWTKSEIGVDYQSPGYVSGKSGCSSEDEGRYEPFFLTIFEKNFFSVF